MILTSPKECITLTYDCNECKDIEWLVIDGAAKPCKCQSVKRQKYIIERSGLSEIFRQKTFDNFEVGRPEKIIKALHMCKRYADNFELIRRERNNSIALLGQAGCGKTHLLLAIFNRLMSESVGVCYMQYREEMTKLKQCITDAENYQNSISRFKTVPVLMIDDLYKGKITESDVNIMFEIINHRYIKNLPMMISSEKSMESILEVDEGIGSRIYEMCKGRIVELRGKELSFRYA